MKYLTLTDIYGSPVDSKLIHDGELNIDALVSAVTYAIAEKWQIKLTDIGEEKGLIPVEEVGYILKMVSNSEEELDEMDIGQNGCPQISLNMTVEDLLGYNLATIETPTIEDTVADLISNFKDNVNKQQVKRNKKKK